VLFDDDPAARSREFPVTTQWAYLNHAGIGPLPRAAAERMAALAHRVAATGDREWPQRNDEAERVRALAARLLGARRPHEVAFVENTSTGLSAVAEGLAWRPGDNLVGAAGDFPSNVYPWMNLVARGVDYRVVPEREGRIDPAELLATIDERTRLVAISWVQYATGFRHDLARIGAACRAVGALLVVDVIQGLGALALDVERDLVDVAVASAHKWLLGPEGIALLYVSDRVVPRLRPTRAGWRSMRDMLAWTELSIDWAEGARRFESGTLNTYGIHALGASLELLLAAGAAAVEARVLALADRAAAGLSACGLQLSAPRHPGETSGIVTATHPLAAAGPLVDHLLTRGIVTAARAGRLRVAPHFYNTEQEIDRFLNELDAYPASARRAGAVVSVPSGHGVGHAGART
jgi:selenocysteine lyase/cysteine desulfurase